MALLISLASLGILVLSSFALLEELARDLDRPWRITLFLVTGILSGTGVWLSNRTASRGASYKEVDGEPQSQSRVTAEVHQVEEGASQKNKSAPTLQPSSVILVPPTPVSSSRDQRDEAKGPNSPNSVAVSSARPETEQDFSCEDDSDGDGTFQMGGH